MAIVTQGSTSGKDKTLFSNAQLRHMLRTPPSLLSKGYLEFFLEGGGWKFGPKVKVTTQLHLVRRSGIVEPCLYSHIRLHGMTLN
jgi:hypothetical protein